MNFSYRSEIDGLRALAVIPVVFYHAGFNLFSGGFVGEDEFYDYRHPKDSCMKKIIKDIK